MLAKPLVSIIAAIGSNRQLGKDNKLLWHIPQDLQRFRLLTSGHAVVMGRKTFQSIGRPLPKRTNIVVTRNRSFSAEGVFTAYSIEEALLLAKKYEKEEIFIIGGAQIYEQSLPYVDKIYLTIVKGKFDADTFFPDYGEFKKIISKEEIRGGEVTFLELEKDYD